jgi:pimeloyl-ACP methyl ester carboxylesterase
MNARKIEDRRVLVLPGMGADARMYPGVWRKLERAEFLEWPRYAGERSIREIAERVSREAGVADGDVVIGSSLGGIVACEIAKLRKLSSLVLVGSATRKEEVSALLRVFSPLIGLAPLEFIQRAAGKMPGELMQMFEASQADFIRAMCAAIFEWDGLGEDVITPLRVHGRSDRVIPLPSEVDLVLEGGHLIAMTHAEECVRFLIERGVVRRGR